MKERMRAVPDTRHLALETLPDKELACGLRQRHACAYSSSICEVGDSQLVLKTEMLHAQVLKDQALRIPQLPTVT